MSDPYKVLEISPDATDDQVKEAYRKMAKKYHPDNYAGSPIADLATEKMKEVNEAYDQIINDRKQGRKSGGSSSQSAGGSWERASNPGSGSSNFQDVRSLIMSGRLADAEQILNGVPIENRNAEWYFLKGTVLYRRGWLEEAYNHFARAVQMDPSNPEYQAAMNQMNARRRGVYGGYNPNMQRGGCTGCDVCSGLLCADCCCECMGGDCIRGC